MTIATVINAVLIFACVSVLLQSFRMDRRMRAFRANHLAEGVIQLDHATGRARTVLGELKRLLATDGVAQANALTNAEALRDELSVMVGIGNAVADRIVDAAATSNARQAEAAAAAEAEKAKPARRRTTKAATGEGKAKTAKAATTRTRRTTKAAAPKVEAEVAEKPVALTAVPGGAKAAARKKTATANELKLVSSAA